MRMLVALPAAVLLADPVGSALAEDETRTEPHTVWTEVHFEFDSTELSESARAELDRAAEWIKSNDTGVIVVEGYADRVGSEPYNKRLAESRGLAAKQYLVSRGVSAAQIHVISYGEALPAVDTVRAERANRRIVLIGVQKEPIIERRTQRVEVPVDRPVYIPARYRPRPARQPIDMQVMAGGGVTDFLADYTNAVTDLGGLWTVRVVGGTNQWFGFEAAYVGTAQDIDMVGAPQGAWVVGRGLEGDLRLNLVRGRTFQPYLFAGVGWASYGVSHEDAMATVMSDTSDNVFVFPAGAGLSFRLTADLILDLRGTLRGAADDSMFESQTATRSDGLESWSTTAHVGVAF